MTEYEWETRRVPKAFDARAIWQHRSRNARVAEYVALEFPRETVASVVRQDLDRLEKSVERESPKAAPIAKERGAQA